MKKSERWSNLSQRIVTALVLAAISLLLIWLGSGFFMFEVALFALAGSAELFDMIERKRLRPLRRSGSIATLLLLFSAWQGGVAGLAVATLVSMLALLSLCVLRFRQRQSLLLDGATTWLTVMYIGWLFSFLVLLRGLPCGAGWITLLIAMVTCTDAGAYFVGRSLGRTPLCPQLSPKKTLEGSLGGLLLPAVVGWLSAGYFGICPVHAALLGVGVSFFGQIGDLWESAVKREVGVKDAGDLLGSHGGVLDRFDSMAFAAPFFYLFLLYITHQQEVAHWIGRCL